MDRTQYIGAGITLPFYFIHRTNPPFSAESVMRPRPTCTTTIVGERPPSSTPPTWPTPSSPSRPTFTLNSPHFPRFITCHHRPARAIYTYLPTYGGAPRLGLIGNGPIFGISAHSLRDPPPQRPLSRFTTPRMRGSAGSSWVAAREEAPRGPFLWITRADARLT